MGRRDAGGKMRKRQKEKGGKYKKCIVAVITAAISHCLSQQYHAHSHQYIYNMPIYNPDYTAPADIVDWTDKPVPD